MVTTVIVMPVPTVDAEVREGDETLSSGHAKSRIRDQIPKRVREGDETLSSGHVNCSREAGGRIRSSERETKPFQVVTNMFLGSLVDLALVREGDETLSSGHSTRNVTRGRALRSERETKPFQVVTGRKPGSP